MWGPATTSSSGTESSESRTFVVDRGDARRRLDLVLLDRLPHDGLSRARVQRWITAGRVTIDGTCATRAASRVAEGQRVDILWPKAVRRQHQPEAIPLSIVYEDEWLLAVDKPAGLVAHPTRHYPTGTLVNALRAYVHGTSVRPRLVHRLDRGTSGLLLVAKSREVHAALARAMARRQVTKTYLALVHGTPPVDRDRIDLRIGRDGSGRLAASKTEGRACTTSYELLERSEGSRAGLSLLQCTLGTGRLHQIRVHLSAIGLPIVGDPLYGEPRWKGISDPSCARACEAFPTQALHAGRLQFAHPVTGRALDLHAPLSPALARLLAAAGIRPRRPDGPRHPVRRPSL